MSRLCALTRSKSSVTIPQRSLIACQSRQYRRYLTDLMSSTQFRRWQHAWKWTRTDRYDEAIEIRGKRLPHRARLFRYRLSSVVCYTVMNRSRHTMNVRFRRRKRIETPFCKCILLAQKCSDLFVIVASRHSDSHIRVSNRGPYKPICLQTATWSPSARIGLKGLR